MRPSACVHPRCATAVLAACLLLAAPVSAASSSATVAFLRDGDLPVVDGLLDPTVPDATEPSTRPVVAGSEEVAPVRFVTVDPAPASTLRGPLIMGLWLGESTVAHGNITATAYLVRDGVLEPIGNASVAVDADPDEAPDPTQLIPPDPTDPEGSVYYELAQVMPLLLRPPMVLNLGVVDHQDLDGAHLAVAFRLDQGSSPVPVPVGAFATLQYDSVLAPSFLYIPWSEPPPPTTKTATETTTSSSATSTGPTTLGPTDRGDDAGKDSPVWTAGLAAVALVGAAAFLRRRL